MGKAASLIMENRYSIQEIAEMVGYSDTPVSYTHLDVYKRQPYVCIYIPVFQGMKNKLSLQINVIITGDGAASISKLP